jgi:hypothetical protein
MKSTPAIAAAATTVAAPAPMKTRRRVERDIGWPASAIA